MSAITSVFLLARSAFGLGDAFFVPLLLSSGFFAVLRLGSGAAVSAAVLASDSFVIIVFSLSRNGFAGHDIHRSGSAERPGNSRSRSSQIASAGVPWPCMQVAAGSCDRTVPQRSLHQVNWRTVIQRMACVSMPEPVRAKVINHSGSLRRTSQDYADAAAIETPAAA